MGTVRGTGKMGSTKGTGSKRGPEKGNTSNGISKGGPVKAEPRRRKPQYLPMFVGIQKICYRRAAYAEEQTHVTDVVTTS